MKIYKVLAALAFAVAPLPALAGPITFSFLNGNRSASAEFARSGNNLVITLTNTSTADVLVPTDVLTAVFFQVDGNPLLSRTSAIVAPGSSVLVGGTGAVVTPGGGIIGGEWSYANSVIAVPSQNAGVSSTGVDVFGPGNRFPGANLQGPDSPDGVQYGITSTGDNLLTGNGGLSGEHLIKNSVVFTLGGFTWEPDVKILSAMFLYGTSLSEPQFGGNVPEPASWVLLSAGACGMLAFARGRNRRREKSASFEAASHNLD